MPPCHNFYLVLLSITLTERFYPWQLDPLNAKGMVQSGPEAVTETKDPDHQIDGNFLNPILSILASELEMKNLRWVIIFGVLVACVNFQRTTSHALQANIYVQTPATCY